MGEVSSPNIKYLWEYPQYVSGQESLAVINQAFADLTAAGGGKLMLPMGTVSIGAKMTIPSNVFVEGFGVGITTLRLANGVDDDIVNFDTHSNCGIRYLTISGNTWSGAGQSGKDGLIIGRPGINTTNNEGNMPNVLINNIEIRDVGGNGFHCYAGTWIYYISKVAVRYCTNYGMWIESTDNMYDTIEVTACGSYGVYVTGSNNRLSGMKIIFNGRGQLNNGKFLGTGNDITSAGLRVTGSRNTLVNIESQENYGHGFVFDGAKDADLVGLLADKNGYSALAATDGVSLTGSATAIGFYFMNSCARLTGILKATNFHTGRVSQLSEYFIDNTCASLSLDIERDTTQAQGVNLSYSSFVTTSEMRANMMASIQATDFLTSGNVLTNAITAYDSTNFALGSSFVTAHTIVGNEIQGITTNWGSNPRIGTPGNTSITKDRLYLVRVKVKPSSGTYNFRLKAIYNEGTYATIRQLDGTFSAGAYSEMSFVFKADQTSTKLMVFVDDKVLNTTQQAFSISELAIVDVTNAVGKGYTPKAIDKLVNKNYFLGTRTFN